MLVLARTSGFAVTAGTTTTARHGFGCGGQQSNNQRQAEITDRSHDSVVVRGLMRWML